MFYNSGTPVAKGPIISHRQLGVQSFDLYVDVLAWALLG